jgi:prepilin-type N-terminal cleavage/methylation domain-containing protein
MGRRRRPIERSDAVRKNMIRRRAFTLIELLVVIAIVALLIAILLPALGRARVSSRQTKALANARSVAQSFELYLGANAEAYPFTPPTEQDPGLPGGGGVVFVVWYPRGVVIGESSPFTLSWAWPSLVSSVTPWEQAYETWVSPGKDTDLPELPADGQAEEINPREDVSWRLSGAFLADPRAFATTPPASPVPPKQLIRAVKGHEVALPAAKALVWDTHLAYLPEPRLVDGHWDALTPTAFADGHAEARNPTEAKPGVANALTGESRALANTAEGVRGVDY